MLLTNAIVLNVEEEEDFAFSFISLKLGQQIDSCVTRINTEI